MTPDNYSRRIAEHLGTISTYWMDGQRQYSYPDYAESLDDMHEAEKTLTSDQASKCGEHLDRIVLDTPMSYHYYDLFKLAHATAAQHAEAFCKTLDL